MALIACPDCGHQVSDQAPACVNCGRPILPTAAVTEICEVSLRRLRGLGLIRQPLWVLEARAISPAGIRLVDAQEYNSNNEGTEHQGDKKEFHSAVAVLTNRLLAAGWVPVGSTHAGGSVMLPRFQRMPPVTGARGPL